MKLNLKTKKSSIGLQFTGIIGRYFPIMVYCKARSTQSSAAVYRLDGLVVGIGVAAKSAYNNDQQAIANLMNNRKLTESIQGCGKFFELFHSKKKQQREISIKFISRTFLSIK